MTWTKIRNLTKAAKTLLLQQGKPLSPCMYFIAFLALISAPPTVESTGFWAYVPRPPLLQPVGWFDPKPIKVLVNDTMRLGGLQDSDVRPRTSSYITYEGKSDTLPIYIVLQEAKVPFGCLKTSYRTFLTDAPDRQNKDKRWMWEFSLLILGYSNYNKTYQKVTFMPIPACIQLYRDINQFWDASVIKFPTWLSCGFPHSAVKHTPVGTDVEIWDFSVSSGDKQYKKYIKDKNTKFHGYTPQMYGEPLTRWYSPGLVEPIWVARNPQLPDASLVVHKDLFSCGCKPVYEKNA